MRCGPRHRDGVVLQRVRNGYPIVMRSKQLGYDSERKRRLSGISKGSMIDCMAFMSTRSHSPLCVRKLRGPFRTNGCRAPTPGTHRGTRHRAALFRPVQTLDGHAVLDVLPISVPRR